MTYEFYLFGVNYILILLYSYREFSSKILCVYNL